MKKFLAFLLAFFIAFCYIGLALPEQPATPTDLEPVITDVIPDEPPGDDGQTTTSV